MSENNGMVELYRKYRPSLFKHVLGQEKAVRILEKLIKADKVPHALMLTGGSGTGKSTLAFILRNKLGCSDTDFTEINCAVIDKPTDTVRAIQQTMNAYPMNGKCRVWLLEEIQAWSKSGFAQQALLNMLEHPPQHAYFFLTTTDPAKIISAVKTRCTILPLVLLTDKVVEQSLRSIAEKEGKTLSDEVVARIVEVAEGSARKALVLLHQIISIEDPEEQLEAIQSSDSKRQAIDLCRALLDSRKKWSEVAAIIKEIEDEPETIRRMVLSYASSVCLGGGKLSARAYVLLLGFESNWYDTGKAGLVRACFEVFSNKD